MITSAIPSNHLPQLVFLRELSAQNLEVADKGLAAVDECFFRGDVAVGLNAEFEGCEERVGYLKKIKSACAAPRVDEGHTFVACERYMYILEEMSA